MAGVQVPERIQATTEAQEVETSAPAPIKRQPPFAWLRKIRDAFPKIPGGDANRTAPNNDEAENPAPVATAVIEPKPRGNSSANTGPKGPRAENARDARRTERSTRNAALKKQMSEQRVAPASPAAAPEKELDEDVKIEQEFLRTAPPEEIRRIAIIRLQTLLKSENPPVILADDQRKEYARLVQIVSGPNQKGVREALLEIEKRLQAAQVVDATWKKLLDLDLEKLKQPSKRTPEVSGTPRTFGFINGKLRLKDRVFAATPSTHDFLQQRGDALPENVTNWERTKTTMILGSEQLPWLGENHGLITSLDLVTMTLPNSGKSLKIFLGTAVGDSRLKDALADLISHPEEAQAAERVFFRDLGRHLNGDMYRTLKFGRSSTPTNVASNGGKGERVYYIEPGSIDGNRIIVIIGACRKAQQLGDVSSTLWGGK